MVCLHWFCPRRRTGHVNFDGSQLPNVKNQFFVQVSEVGSELCFLFWNAGRKDPHMLNGKFIIVIIYYKSKCTFDIGSKCTLMLHVVYTSCNTKCNTKCTKCVTRRVTLFKM